MRLTLSQWIYFCIFCFSVVVMRPSFAQNEACSLTGYWVDDDPEGGTGEWELTQDGANLTGFWVLDYENLTCGAVQLSGTVNSSEFKFKAVYEKPGAGQCNWWAELKGAFFSSDCMSVQGQWTNSDGSFGTFRWLRKYSVLYISEPKAGEVFTITKEPLMPIFNAVVEVKVPYNLAASTIEKEKPFQFTWNIQVQHNLTSQRILTDNMPTASTDVNRYTPDFDLLNGIRGGMLRLSVQYDRTLNASATYRVNGANPGADLIEQFLSDSTIKHIACRESSYRQFDAQREGGQGLPLLGLTSSGNNGGVGVMQVYNPPSSDDAVWNWKQNMLEGQAVLDEKRKNASNLHITERERLNQERQKQGLPLCPSGVPTPLTPNQLEREAIRRYNCGREYRWEPRDGVNCVGQWVIQPTLCEGGDPDYVERVLKCTVK